MNTSFDITKDGDTRENHGHQNSGGQHTVSLNDVIYAFTPRDVFTVRDACEGVCIMGATGSGKTTGSGRALRINYLDYGMGGLVMTVKMDERPMWEQDMHDLGREDDLVVISPDNPHRFNFLDYAARQHAGSGMVKENLVKLFANVLEVGSRTAAKSTDPFWQQASDELLGHTVNLLLFAKGTVSFLDIGRVINSAPDNLKDAQDPMFLEQSFCWKMMLWAKKSPTSYFNEHDFEMLKIYFAEEFPRANKKTMSCVRQIVLSMTNSFKTGYMHELFCTETNITPQDTYQGKVIVLDLPVNTFGDAGRYAQLVFKYLFQQASRSRDIEEYPLPVFLWADEAQEFIATKDAEFQSVSRANRVCTVYLTQNINNYFMVLKDSGGKSAVESFMGNLQTKIWHANSDPATNEWATQMIGKTNQVRVSTSYNYRGMRPRDLVQGVRVNRAKQLEFQVQPMQFTTLKKGGTENNCIVEGVVFQGGRIWQNKKNYLIAAFNQVDDVTPKNLPAVTDNTGLFKGNRNTVVLDREPMTWQEFKGTSWSVVRYLFPFLVALSAVVIGGAIVMAVISLITFVGELIQAVVAIVVVLIVLGILGSLFNDQQPGR